ncbi:peptidoglycan-binding protein [Streptomyces sp. NPDC048257]|uniref:peptidoglycan-binding domain-containing protein n=1 Tax=Streptomyces sp. NPDC048257 TaxID=3365526 RepID=UPI00372017C2
MRCACGIAHHDATAGPAAAPAQFDREWVRPYVSLREPAPGDEPAAVTSTTTVTWVVPQVVRESRPSGDGHAFGPPVDMTGPARHRAHGPTRRRRPLRITTALATLIGSAAIAGAYALSRDQDTRGVASPPPASRLDVLDVDETPDAATGQTPPQEAIPGGAERTTPTGGQSPMGTASSAAPSTSSTPSAATSGAAPRQDHPETAPSSGAPSASPDRPTLRRHDTGPEVQELQRRLAQIGAWSMPQRGRYDRHLHDAVARFQATHGVRGDPPGVYGPATRRLLESLTS